MPFDCLLLSTYKFYEPAIYLADIKQLISMLQQDCSTSSSHCLTEPQWGWCRPREATTSRWHGVPGYWGTERLGAGPKLRARALRQLLSTGSCPSSCLFHAQLPPSRYRPCPTTVPGQEAQTLGRGWLVGLVTQLRPPYWLQDVRPFLNHRGGQSNSK